MATVVTFLDYTPPERADAIAWTQVEIYESSEVDGTYTLIDTLTLSPPEPDPADPLSRDFTTILGTGEDLWYKVRFLDGGGGTSEYSDPVQNVSEDLSATPYATVAELARHLSIRAPTAEQTAIMTRVLTAAAFEIDSELGRYGAFGSPYPDLVVQVNIERAEEHWRQLEAPFGLIALGVDVPAERTGQNSWERHALKLAPLKQSWGLA
jgi:hypothetical protein